MTRQEINKLNMQKAVSAVLTENNSLVEDYPALTEAAEELRAKIAEIINVEKEFSTSTGGKTNTKNMIEEELLEELVPIKSAMYAYAVKTKNEELKSITKESESALRRMPDTELLKRAEIIKAEAQKQKEQLSGYKITETILNELEEKIRSYEAAIKGKDTSFAGRSALRVALSGKFAEADEIINEQIDELIETVRKSYPLLYEQYKAARVIKDLGGAHKAEEEKPDGSSKQ